MQHRPSLSDVKSDLFKGLAHPLRIRVLELLSEADDGPLGEVAVAELLAQTGLEASHLSQHLSVLRKYGLVESERRGSQVYYRLAFASVAGLLDAARALLGELLEARGDELAQQLDAHHAGAR
ncbi:metalloregulator ArsR/SmtB family transcription factor [Gryllotalpicola koreensis]|uniref:HTH arsR-type domain-containing protein n=1 Tax=Gryllotalpicola koreensis TaxID=993086 RepID=A0ABP8A6Y7_9MICO